MLEYWIWLSSCRRLGPRQKKALLEHYRTPEAVYLSEEKALRRLEFMQGADASSLMNKDLSPAENVLALCRSRGTEIVTLFDPRYPQTLAALPDAPILLYCEGKLPDTESRPVITMVGSRTTSAYGLKYAYQIGYQLASAGALVVSGGAKGIDTAALRGALAGGGTAVAVFACGTDVIYPRENAQLFEAVRRNGCILSEYEPGTQAFASHFPVRNRILSGLSLGTVVVEAPASSGALITADYALSQGRDVFTIPAALDSITMQGNLRLIRDGAILIESGQDVLGEYRSRFPEICEKAAVSVPESKLPAAEKPAVARPDEKKPAPEKRKAVDNPKNGNYIDIEKIVSELTSDEAAVLRTLENGPLTADEIIESTGLSAAKVLSAATLLEIRGYLRHLPGKRFALAEKS